MKLPTHWEGVIGFEGELTGDGRIIEHEALTWETPLPLRSVKEDIGAHDGAVVVGRILTIERRENGELWGAGDFDLDSPEGQEAARQVGKGIKVGVSMDMDTTSFEERIAKDLFDQWQPSEDVSEDEDTELADDENESEKSDEDVKIVSDENGDYVVIGEYGPEDFIMVLTSARVRAATLVDIPAFKNAVITEAQEKTAETLVASAAPIDPPSKWFDNPNLEGPTAITITDDGQVYGHLATWDTCHTGEPEGKYSCTLAPRSKTDYAYFKTGVVKTDDGGLVSTGVLRFSTRHAGLNLTAEDARSHYDHTGTAGADITVGEDKHGIWVAGALRPDITDEEVRVLRASPLSGDWRPIKGNLELVGALAVNQPGFPIPRPEGMVASGEITALVAAGSVAPEQALTVKQFSDADARYLKKLVERERNHDLRQLQNTVRMARKKASVSRVATDLKMKRLREAKKSGM